MSMTRVRFTHLVTIAVGLLVAPVVFGQATTDADRSSKPRQHELADVAARRNDVIQETLERWRSQFHPFDPALNIGGEEERLTAALQRASTEELLAASQAQTWEELSTALSGGWRGPSVVALPPGSTPNVLGDANADLVFTPVTPCRIIDTRIATGLFAGKIGPNDGKQFSVSLADYTAQGGFAGSCGIPIEPGAVAINVVSTGQTGVGNLRVIQSGGGIPNAALLNYTPGVNLANAAVVRSAAGLGGDNIFIYSGNSQSDVVVDIMGFFAAPVATQPDNELIRSAFTSVAASTDFNIFSPTCSAGYRLSGGGYQWGVFDPGDVIVVSSRPSQLGTNTNASWLCQGRNRSAVAQSLTCWAVCTRIPGR